MKNPFLRLALTAGLLLAHSASHAEDIDLFVNLPPNADSMPNVLFVVDNTANWGSGNNPQPFGNLKTALSNTFANLPENRFRVGIMFSAETGQNDNNVSGGYVRAAMRPMTSTNKARYRALIDSLDPNDDKGNGGVASLVMAEAYRYFSGGAAYAGNNKAKTDYAGNACEGCNQLTAPNKLINNAIYALSGNALDSKSAANYNAAIPPGHCGNNYIIYISNGPSGDNNASLEQARAMLAAAGGNTSQISISPSGSQGNLSDEWARFMKQQHGIVTYTIDVNPGTSGQGPGWTALLKSMAGVSSGKYFSVSSANGGADINDAVNKALSEIQAVNSVFASVSLPVSVNTQGTFLNQVFIGMFRPDAMPRWSGNLKQYRLGRVNDALRLVDADGESAINSSTDFITECARSYWTPTPPPVNADSYWSFRPAGACIPPSGSAENLYSVSNSPDGSVVEKGAQAQRLRSSTARTLKTCSPTFASCTTLTDFNTGNTAITAGLLNAADAAERNQLIEWARGLDLDDENNNGNTTGEMRPSVHGDVVHSRPVAINFGTDASPKVVVFYGGNDGVLRAINGNRTQDIGTVAPGGELWGFIPPEFYRHIKRLRTNTTQINFPNLIGGQPKPYGIDGPITAFKDSSRAWIYATMRRGGRALYAFNVNPNNPADISLKWKKGCPNTFAADGSVSDADCSTGFSGIGQTWSPAKVFNTSAYGGGTSPLLIMGGGYDPCEDADRNTCTAATKGNKIYVLDADTGTPVKTFDTDRAVIGEISIPWDASGLTKYAYAADLGGNVYRLSFGATQAEWTMTKIASLGCDGTSSCASNRKFMFGPDVLTLSGGEYALLIGSGDREKPLAAGYYPHTNTVANRFYMLRDRPADNTWLSTEAGRCGGVAVICHNSLSPIAVDGASPTRADIAAQKGWYLAMRPTEQVVTSAITVFGGTSFSTHEPAVAQAGMCSSTLGTARQYSVLYTTGAPTGGSDRSGILSSGGLPPSPIVGKVLLDGDPPGTETTFCIGCFRPPIDDDPPCVGAIEGCEPPPPTISAPPKSRVFWYIEP